MSRYLGINQLVTDLTFGWFMVSWLVTRHILFLFVIKSTLFDGPKLIAFRWDPVAGHYVTKTMHHGFSALLLVLQVRSFRLFCDDELMSFFPPLESGTSNYMVLDDLQDRMESGRWRQRCL